MSDIADLAQFEEHMDRNAAIAAALNRPAGCEAGPVWIDGKAHCRHCEERIPEKRLLAVPGTGLCVACASEAQEGLKRCLPGQTTDNGMQLNFVYATPGAVARNLARAALSGD